MLGRVSELGKARFGKVFGGGDDTRNANNQVADAKGQLDFEFARDLKEVMVGLRSFTESLAGGNRQLISQENARCDDLIERMARFVVDSPVGCPDRQ